MVSGIDWAHKIPVGGVYTAIAADDSANKATINSGKPNAVGALVQIVRAGVVVGADAKVSVTAGVIAVEDGSSYKVTTGDVISWIAF